MRLEVTTNDIVKITGKTKKASMALLRRIRAKYNKPKPQIILVNEVSEYLGLPIEVLRDTLGA